MNRRYYIWIMLLCNCLCIPNLNAQETELPVSRLKALMILDNLDSLITDYENSAVFVEDSGTDYQAIRKFRSLFQSDTTLLFDDINPNIVKGKEDYLNEKTKPLADYINDIVNEFYHIRSEIIYTNASSAMERIYFRDSSYYFSVIVLKRNEAFFRDSTKSRSIRSEAELEMWIRLIDTVHCDLEIAGISKAIPLAAKWQYELPALKRKKMEAAFFLKPVYSVFYPQSNKMTGYDNILLLDQNPLMRKLGLESNGFENNYIWGHYGMNADLELRFFWRKEDKNKTKGFSFGVGGGIYNSFFQTDTYSDYYYETDRDNDGYYRITNIQDLSEIWSIATVDIPVKYSSEKWKTYTKGRYFKIGARLSYVTGMYFARGTYDRTGYYPEYGVFLQNIPRYGFESNAKIKERDLLNLNPYNVAIEVTFGKKRKTKSGKSVIYTGLNLGAYYDDFLPRSDNAALFDSEVHPDVPPVYTYNGVMSLMGDARLGYAGIVFGIRSADRNEFIMKKKELRYSSDYADPYKKEFKKVIVPGIYKRDFSAMNVLDYYSLNKKDRPQFRHYTNSSDPLRSLELYIDTYIELSKAERRRLRREKAKEIEFSFVIDQDGMVQDVKIITQENTEYGAEVFRIIRQTSTLWSPGRKEGIPVSTLIEMTYKN